MSVLLGGQSREADPALQQEIEEILVGAVTALRLAARRPRTVTTTCVAGSTESKRKGLRCGSPVSLDRQTYSRRFRRLANG